MNLSEALQSRATRREETGFELKDEERLSKKIPWNRVFIINPLSAKLIFQGLVQGHYQGQGQGRSQGQGQSLGHGHVQGHGRGHGRGQDHSKKMMAEWLDDPVDVNIFLKGDRQNIINQGKQKNN